MAYREDEVTGEPNGYGLFVKEGAMVQKGVFVAEYVGEVRGQRRA